MVFFSLNSGNNPTIFRSPCDIMNVFDIIHKGALTVERLFLCNCTQFNAFKCYPKKEKTAYQMLNTIYSTPPRPNNAMPATISPINPITVYPAKLRITLPIFSLQIHFYSLILLFTSFKMSDIFACLKTASTSVILNWP